MQTQFNFTLDTRNLSDRRLWDLVRQAEQSHTGVDALLMARVRRELRERRQGDDTRRWNAPR